MNRYSVQIGTRSRPVLGPDVDQMNDEVRRPAADERAHDAQRHLRDAKERYTLPVFTARVHSRTVNTGAQNDARVHVPSPVDTTREHGW